MTNLLVEEGHNYREGKNNYRQSIKEATRLYQLAASQGDLEGQAWLATSYLMNWNGLNNDEEAFRLSEIGVKNQVPLAYNNLAYCYERGIGTMKDTKRALQLYEKGASLGNSWAKVNLGYWYLEQEGVENKNKAFDLFQHAKEQGEPHAFNALGIYWREMKDPKKAIPFFQAAANKGCLCAYINLGFYYIRGQGVKQNLKKGIRYYRRAIDQGELQPMLYISFCYQEGLGVKPDFNEQRYWQQLGKKIGVRKIE